MGHGATLGAPHARRPVSPRQPVPVGLGQPPHSPQSSPASIARTSGTPRAPRSRSRSQGLRPHCAAAPPSARPPRCETGRSPPRMRRHPPWPELRIRCQTPELWNSFSYRRRIRGHQGRPPRAGQHGRIQAGIRPCWLGSHGGQRSSRRNCRGIRPPGDQRLPGQSDNRSHGHQWVLAGGRGVVRQSSPRSWAGRPR